jgi:hypothetical protein
MTFGFTEREETQGAFDCEAASLSRSSFFAKDDKTLNADADVVTG